MSITEGTREAYIRAAVLGGFTQLVGEHGVEAGALIARAGIPERALSDPDMLVSWHGLGDLMEITAAEMSRPSLGLDWVLAVPKPFLNFGPLGLLARFSDTLGEWCVIARNYWRFHTNAYGVQLLQSEDGEDLLLRFDVDPLIPPSRHQMEYTLGGTCQMVRMLADFDDARFKRVRFQHLEPADTSVHERVFRCDLEFGCPHNELVYDKRMHAFPIDYQIEALAGLFCHYISARTANAPDYDGSMRATVEIAVPSLIGTGYCTLGHVAQLLCVSPKTLQRQLAKEGTNFAQILDSGRQRMARQLLVESEAPMASIAGLLGYAKTPPFTVAFKRWTGMSPRQYRKTMRPEGDFR